MHIDSQKMGKLQALVGSFNAEAQSTQSFWGCLRQGLVRRSQGLGVRNWSSFRVFGVFRGPYQPRTPYSRQLRRATSRHKTFEFYLSSTAQAAQSYSISNTGGWLIAPPPHANKIYPTFHSLLCISFIHICY